ncbi:MAG TPA: tRNA pseudouridine(55) synthase TruB [Candidatus Tectomicrobia bacterium]|nr:tRNA pseudouridine(55) synthase TruB [Candidatus Tectomicrobia bacterium]
MERKLRSFSANSKPDRNRPQVEGLLNIDKPRHRTSHDVVAHIRRLTGVARVGHAGTLDPQATGVLLVSLGTGTKLTPFLHECPKTYRATLQLGVRTDSHDAVGKIIEVRAVGRLDHEHVEAVLTGFRGAIDQIPPMHSALKRRGRRLYDLARQGLDVERQPRRVEIFGLTLVDLCTATLTLEVQCSSGTYIRVLADDIGTQLGCGAHLSALVRTAIGPFRLDQALTLDAFDAAVRQDKWPAHVISLARGMDAFAAIVVTSASARALTHGIPPTAAQVVRVEGAFEVGQTVAIKGPNGELLAVGAACVRAPEIATTSPATAIMHLRRVLHHSP